MLYFYRKAGDSWYIDDEQVKVKRISKESATLEHLDKEIKLELQESVNINGCVVVLQSTKGTSLKVGLDAPDDIQLYRTEIYDRIQAGIPKGD